MDILIWILPLTFNFALLMTATPFGIRIHLLLRKATGGLTFLSTVFLIVLLVVGTLFPNILDVQQTFLLLNQYMVLSFIS